MFTGIVQSIGQVLELQPQGDDMRLKISTGALSLDDAHIGDSIAVSGVCLTGVDFDEASFVADVSRETLRCTTLGELRPGTAVNLEKALTANAPLGGHFVSGHVDGVTHLLTIEHDARSVRMTFATPPELARYIARKGSVCVDGVSLTVNDVSERRFEVNIVPHTAEATTLGALSPQRSVNIEVDLVARYLEQLLNAREADAGKQLR